MKKIARALPYIALFLAGWVNFGCHNQTIPVPDNERIWWYEKFDSNDEIPSFMTELKDTGKNGDFSLGLSKFEISDYFKLFSIGFSGHIDDNCSSKEDIYNSTYDDFWINFLYHESDPNLSVYNAEIDLYFYPFFLEGKQFDKDKIEYTLNDYYPEGYEVRFEYYDETIMKVELARRCRPFVDKDKMINELISNYKLIV